MNPPIFLFKYRYKLEATCHVDIVSVAAAPVGHDLEATSRLRVTSLGDELGASCRTRWLRRRAATTCQCQATAQARAACTRRRRRQRAPGSKTRTRSAP